MIDFHLISDGKTVPITENGVAVIRI